MDTLPWNTNLLNQRQQQGRQRRRKRYLEQEQNSNDDEHDNKAYKICSVLGGLDVTRFASLNTRHFFEGAIEDVELIREFVTEALSTTTNQNIVDKSNSNYQTIDQIIHTLDWKARGLPEGTTTIQAGLGIVDDRIDRRVDRYIGTHGKPLVGDKTTDLMIVNTVSLLFPWLIDRKSNEAFWWVDHQNGRSEGSTKEPFLFDSLYSAAWIGTYGEAWTYYPPFQALMGHPFGLGDVIGDNIDSHEYPFVVSNLPENNPDRTAFFRNPYPDVAQTGLSLITALAPVYFTGKIGNYTYNDTYIASTGVDIAVASVSTLLDVLEDNLVQQSFGILVDTDFNTIVISQTVVEKLYPKRTGFEDFRITYDPGDGSIKDDRRNQTFLVSDTIYGDLTDLNNTDWAALRSEVRKLRPGERAFSLINLTFADETQTTEFFVMYDRWKYVADKWVLMTFAPKYNVEHAIDIDFVNKVHNKTSSVSLVGEWGHLLSGEARLVNKGTLDVAVTVKSIPSWIYLTPVIEDSQTLRAGEILQMDFDVLTEELEVGTSSVLLSFNIQDDEYPDCFYNKDVSLPVSVKVLPRNCAAITGDKLRRADVNGVCICRTNSVELNGRCVSFFVLFPMIMIPLLLIGFVCVYVYVERKRQQADSVWAVTTSELKFDDPPEVVGRGTFGLVLLAEYRGTQVAVKRVIPPRSKTKSDERTSSTSSSFRTSNGERGSDLFNFKNSLTIDVNNDQANGEDRLQSWVTCTMSSMNSSINKSLQFSQNDKWSLWKNHFGNHALYSSLKQEFLNEMRQLSKLRHPCITTVMGAVVSKWEEPLLVMEYMELGSLYDLLHNETMIMEGYLVLPILRDIAQGLRFLHAATPQVIHGDLKAQNVLVDSKFRAKVADFGLSQKKQVGVTGTPLWMAPELLRRESENTAMSDVYSFGIILYEVYSRKVPYEGEDFKTVLREICDPKINKRPPVPDSMPREVASLMSDALLADQYKRPTFNTLDSRLKAFDVKNVEPGKMHLSMQARKAVSQVDLNEKLLLEIFPKHIAEALKNGRKVEPEHFDVVTIFFSDIVGFTTISESLSPSKVSDMLDRLYMKFDALSHKHGVFKVETIGDAWMGVTNLTEQQPDHTKRIALFSIDAVREANETLIDAKDPASGFVQIRVGFHSGPVLANVVGSRNPKYTIIGDTVNTSSRMESNSLPGRIQCSDAAAKLLASQGPDIKMAHRGKINIKGKGEMDTYWVNERDYRRQSFDTEATPLLRITV